MKHTHENCCNHSSKEENDQNGIKNGEPMNPEIMRKIGVLHDMILVAQTSDFDQRYFVEYNDEMLLTYLSSLTEGIQTMNTMTDTHMVYRIPTAKSERRKPKYKN